MPTRQRKARRAWFCDTCQGHLLAYDSVSTSYGAIQPGDVYLLRTVFPGQEPCYVEGFSHSAQCAACAAHGASAAEKTT